MRASKQIPHLVDNQERDAGIKAKAPVKAARRLLASEVEKHLRGGEEENGVACDDGLMGDVWAINVLPRP